MTRKRLTFGTDGIRAIMGPYEDQLNADTIRRNTIYSELFVEGDGGFRE